MQRHWHRGFTLLELLVVLVIVAMATAGVSLAMRDGGQTALEREAQRLAVLLESARAQSRASGVPVVWRATAQGFRFEGLPPETLPDRWLSEGIVVRSSGAVLLGPEPIIGPQAVVIGHAAQAGDAGGGSLRVATDGLRPFAVGPVEQP